MSTYTIDRRGVGVATALVQLVLLAMAAACPPAQPVVPTEPLDGGLVDAAPVDPMVAAIDVVTASAETVPTTQEQADQWLTARLAAETTLRENQPAVQTKLLADLQQIALADHRGLNRLASVIKLAGDTPEILDVLRGLTMQPLSPAEQAVIGHGEVPTEELTRLLGLELLAHHARRGSLAAKERILGAAASPSIPVRMAAVQVTLAISRNRRQTQRELAAVLPADSQHLLYQY